MKFEGAFTALVTPMQNDGSVDYEGLRKNVEFQISQGISGLVPVGTTGESPTLSWEEHGKVVQQTIEFAAGRCKIIAGTGSNSTEESIESTGQAAKAGASAALMVDCYYNGPSSQELREHYYAPVAAKFPNMAIIPYIIPGRSGTALAPEDLAILAAQYPNIAAVKEATGDLDRMARTRTLCGRDFPILSGDDDLNFKLLTDPGIRAAGMISVATNIVPGPTQQMALAVLSGDLTTAESLQKALAPIFGVITVKVENERALPDGTKVMVSDKYRNPVAIKTLMTGLGLPSGLFRRPLGRMSRAGVEVVRGAVRKVWNDNPEMLTPLEKFYSIDVAARIADDSVWGALCA